MGLSAFESNRIAFGRIFSKASRFGLRYDDLMKRYGLVSLAEFRKTAAAAFSDSSSLLEKDGAVSFKIIGLASLAVGVAALGVYLGRELRSRYKFNRRTPYERYGHSGDEGAAVGEFGMGV
jgi:hypothetical protein